MKTVQRPAAFACVAIGAILAFAPAMASAAPAGPREIPVRITGQGVRPAHIAVKTGETVVFALSGDGRIRSFRIEGLGVSTIVPPEQTVKLNFTADHAGSFVVDCEARCDAKATPASLVVAD